MQPFYFDSTKYKTYLEQLGVPYPPPPKPAAKSSVTAEAVDSETGIAVGDGEVARAVVDEDDEAVARGERLHVDAGVSAAKSSRARMRSRTCMATRREYIDIAVSLTSSSSTSREAPTRTLTP